MTGVQSACLSCVRCPILSAVPPDDDLPRSPLRWLPFLTAVAILSLVSNAALGWCVWQNAKTQGARLARLENRAEALPANDGSRAALGGRPRRAGPDERVALLLSMSGDPDHSRRMLETVSLDETIGIAQALLAQPPANDRNAALGAVIEALGRNDPARAIALLDSVQVPVLRARLATSIAETWSAVHPDAAARWLVGDGARFLDPAAVAAPLLRALAQWSAFDPEAATKFAADQPPDRGPVTRSLGLAGRAWGQKDPQAALAWARALPATDQRRGSIIQSVWQGWTEQNPAQAASALGPQLFNGGRLYADLAGTVAKAWAGVDPGASAQWAVTLPPGSARRNALYQVAVTWTQTDPAGASRWAGSLPAGNTRLEIWREIVGSWADADLDAAGAWLGALPQGRDHDEAVTAYLPKMEPIDPAKALVWAGTISENGLRAEQVQAILARWSRRDPAAARNWAAASGVPVPGGRLGP